MSAAPSRTHALLVGINRYPFIEGAELEGCVNDSALMEGILIEHFEVAPGDIERINDEAATRDGIIAALERFVARVGPDEGAVLFYAGHGSRQRTTAGGWIETLVAADSGREPHPNRDILDFEIDAFVHRLNLKTRWVTLILDCCHAGSVSRERSKSRSVVEDTRDLLAATTPIAAPPAGPKAARLAVMIASCRADEKARETYDSRSRQHHGLFTLLLGRRLGGLQKPTTWRALMQSLVPHVWARNPQQHPLVEGPADTLIFGRAEQPAGQSLTVIERAGEGVVLSGGSIHGVTPGSRWRLDPGLSRVEPVVAEIVRVDSLRAYTAPVRAGIGWPATLEEETLQAPQLTVAVDDALLEEIVERSPLLTQATAEEADVRLEQRDMRWLAIGADGCYVTRPHVLGDRVGLARDLERVARYRGLLEVPLPNQDPLLLETVSFEIERLTSAGAEPAIAAPGAALPRFVEGDRAEFVIRNRGNEPVYVSLVEFGLDRKITLLLPIHRHRTQSLGSYPLDAGETLHLAGDYFSADPRFEQAVVGGLKMRLPDGFPWAAQPDEVRRDGVLTLRLMITREPTDFSFLAQEAVRSGPVPSHPLQALTWIYATGHGSRTASAEVAPQPYAVITRAVTLERGA